MTALLRRLIRPWYRGLRHVLVRLRDLVMSIDTAHEASLKDLGVDDPHRADYEASGWLDLGRVLSRIDVGPTDVFLDLGCGKGRVILLAAGYPFRRVIGVEVSEQLSTVARRNLAARRGRRRRTDVEVVTADVVDYSIPDDVTIVYIFNAFQGPIFDAVIANLIESVDRCPRPVWLIYLNPEEHGRLMGTGRFKLVRTVSRRRPFRDQAARRYLRLYRLDPATPGRHLRDAEVGGSPLDQAA